MRSWGDFWRRKRTKRRSQTAAIDERFLSAQADRPAPLGTTVLAWGAKG
jgi:hypothetical protein